MNRVFNLSTDGESFIRISGPIGESWWDDSGTSSSAFVYALNAIPLGKPVSLFVNSEGGSIKDGLEIFNAIKARAKDVTAYITGYAVSIASVIPLAAGRVVTPKGSVWMLHKPWTGQQGNADDMRKAADMLDKHEEVLVAIYASETGQSREKIKADLTAETWLTGEEAVAYGLADEMSDEPVALASLEQSRFRRMPAALGHVAPHAHKQTDRKGIQMDPNKTETAPVAGTPTPPPAPDQTKPKNEGGDTLEGAKLMAELLTIKAQLAKERKNRIEKAVDSAIAEGQIVQAQRDWWTNAAENDETALATLAGIPKPQAGPTPIRPAGVTAGHACGRDHVMSFQTPKERIKCMVENWQELRQQGRRFAPVAANTGTDSATLLGTMLDQSVITVLQTMLGPLGAFATEVSMDPMVPLQPTIVRVTTAGGTAQTDATSFEDTTNFVGTVVAKTVTPHRYTSGGYLTTIEYNSGNKMAQWSEIKAQEIGEAILGVINALIVTGTFTTDVQTIASAAFAWSDLNTIWGSLAKARTKSAILASAYIAKLLPTTRESLNALEGTPTGWNGLFVNDFWTGATANTQGFFCHPQAIGAVIGVPATPPTAASAGLTQTTITIPGLGAAVQMNSWFNTATRSDWFTLDTVLGAAVLDATAGRILKSA